MSYTGKLTPLALTAISELQNNSGLQIDTVARQYQGTWSPDTGYTQGTITSSNVLNKLTSVLPNFYQAAVSGLLSVNVYRQLITIGRPVNDTTVNCPALGNSRPDSFKTSYAGFGTWQDATVDQYGNRSPGSVYSKIEDDYPPRNYPNSQNYSYVYKEWGSISPGSYTQPYQWDYPYGWLIGWPGKSSWQEDTDTYAAAYYPRPDIRPADASLIDYDSYFSQGFIATVARQAYYEFWSDYSTRRINQYAEFSRSFRLAHDYLKAQNAMIGTYSNSLTYASGSYSNVNDMTSNDISGVSLSFKLFGNDLIRLGKCLDLSRLRVFGLPSALLLTLQQAGALTEALRLALLYNDLTTQELNDILTESTVPNSGQEKKIYQALLLIQGNDLNDIQVITNSTTEGLISLADLLNPKKMFPTSYSSLTVPIYNIEVSTSKYYDLIYVNGGINTRLLGFGDYLDGILDGDIQTACGAFGVSMRQIKNIEYMTCEKFAQVVANLEVVSKGLDLIGGSAGNPINPIIVNNATEKLNFGSGNSGSYRMCDFVGAMSGYPYRDYYKKIDQLIAQLPTSNLSTIYQNIYDLGQSISTDITSDLQNLINQANQEIKNITAAWPTVVQQLNDYWNQIGRQLFIEQRSIPFVAPTSDDFYTGANQQDIDFFIRGLENYSLETDYCEAANIIESISDLSTLGGQCIVANMRESRNAARLLNAMGEMDNDIPDELDAQQATAKICSLNSTGGVSEITVTFGGYGYDSANPPEVVIGPYGGAFGGSGAGAIAQAQVTDGMVSSITVIESGSGYSIVGGCLPVYIDPPPSPDRLGNSIIPGSFAGSEYTGQDPVPDNLVAPASASYNTEEAIDQVSKCNCDCWN